MSCTLKMLFQCVACSNSGEIGYERHEGTVSFNEKCVAQRLTSFKICENGGWSEICDSNFTKSDATVMCRELGYSDIGLLKINGPYYSNNAVTISMSRCTDI